MRRLLILTTVAALPMLVATPGARADGSVTCQNVDAHIASHKRRAEERFADARRYGGGHSALDSLRKSLEIWNPIPTSVEDVVEGEAQDAIGKICKGGLGRLLAGIDLTNKLIAQADVFINENSGMSAGMARTAAKDGKRHLRAANAHQQWKKEHCNCEDPPKEPEVPPYEEDNGKKPKPVPTGGGFGSPGTFNGGGWGTVEIDGSGSGTYTGTYGDQLGTIHLQGDARTGYTGTWAEPGIGREGLLENIQVSSDGRQITGSWRTTTAGEGYKHAQGQFRFVRR